MTKVSDSFFLLSLCVLLATGCDRYSRSGFGCPIAVVPSVESGTKSAAITTSGLEKEGRFVLDAYLDEDSYKYEYDETTHEVLSTTPVSKGLYIDSEGEYNVEHSALTNGWTITPESYWVSEDVTRFWCYWPANSEVDEASEGIRTITAPTLGTTVMPFTYALPTHADGSDATNQKDLIFAYAENYFVNSSRSKDYVDITFRHALSQVRFCVSPDDGTFDVSLQIKKIEILNVPVSGSASFDATPVSGGTKVWFTWTPSTAKATYSQTYDAYFDAAPDGWTASEISGGKHVYTCNNAFMLIPHTLASTYPSTPGDYSTGVWARITFGNTGTGSDETRITKLVDPDDDQTKVWKPGYYYTYKIKATMIGRDIHAYVILADWSDRDSKIII